jgi:acetyl esterase/lipase
MELKALAGPPEPVARVEHIRIQGGGSEIAAGLYIPESATPPAAMVYLHGGGWTIGHYTAVDSIVRELANRSGCAILSIDYRLAPENKYPAALEDARSALRWTRANGKDWGIDSTRVAVGGDSSGGNLAAAVSLLCRDQGEALPAFQLLVYPALDCNYETESYQRFGDGVSSGLSRDDVVWFHHQYVNSPEELRAPYVSPLRAVSLAGMPRTLLICAEIDPLFDDGVAYARRLEEAGVPVELQIVPGMFHGFWRAGGVLAETRSAIALAAEGLKQAMATAVG